MSRIRLVLFALVVAGLSLGVAACGDDGDSTTDSGGGSTSLDLTIGDLVPLTGDLSDFGPPGDKAAQVAVAQINEAAKEAGADHTVTLKTEDDQTSDQAGVSAARKLVVRRCQLHRRLVGFLGDDPGRPFGGDPGGRARDLARVDQ